MVDEEDSKSFGLITRVGSSPTTGTIFAPKCYASEHFLLPISKMLNIFRKRRKNCICRRNLAGEIQMRVDIGCGADVTMPQPFLNFFQAHTIGVQQAGTTVPKLEEAENRVLLVVAESRICYNADRLWFCRSLFCIRRRGLRMARKSRKHQTVSLPHLHSETAGYIRLSVMGKGGDDSIENQKKVIEAWAQENQHSSFVRIS